MIVDRTYETDIMCNLEDGLPFSDPQFESVLMLNVLEHVFKFKKLCNEIKRVIAQGGSAYTWVPFLINVHQDQTDYFRYTDQASKMILQEAKFSQVEVRAYVGLGLVIGTYVGQLFHRSKLVASIIHLMSFGLSKTIYLASPNKNARTWPLGYLVIAPG